MEIASHTPHGKRPIVCRYFASSGTCFYGSDCQFLHASNGHANHVSQSTGQSASSPFTLPSVDGSSEFYPSSEKKTSSSTFPATFAPPFPPPSVESLTQKAQHLNLSGRTLGQNAVDKVASGESLPTFQDMGTTYYYNEEETNKEEGEGVEVKSEETEPVSHAYNLYTGPSAVAQDLYQRLGKFHPPDPLSYFVSEDIRMEILHRNSLTLALADPSIYPDLPSEVDQFHELVPLEPMSSLHAVKSSTFGFVTSTYKARHMRTGNHYCLKRVHGFRLSSTKCLTLVETWKKISSSFVIRLREVFTSKAFGDHSIVFVYDYHAGAETLMSRHFGSGRDLTKGPDVFSDDPSVPKPYTHQKNRLLQQQAEKGFLPEALLWHYVCQLTGALQSIQGAGLAARILDPTKILITAQNRIKLGAVGVFDVLTFDSSASNPVPLLPHYQQEDLMALGKLLLALACNSLLALQRENFQVSLDLVARNYSPDFRNLVLYLLANPQQRTKSVTELLPFVGPRLLTEFDAASASQDIFLDQLGREIDNSRLFRLLTKVGAVVDRPELNLDGSWSETGDRYLLKLFRDYLLHAVTEDGRPWLDLGHIIHTLNKLDAGSQEKICLMSRDEQNVLVVSYAELQHCIESAFGELQAAAISKPPPSTVQLT